LPLGLAPAGGPSWPRPAQYENRNFATVKPGTLNVGCAHAAADREHCPQGDAEDKSGPQFFPVALRSRFAECSGRRERAQGPRTSPGPPRTPPMASQAQNHHYPWLKPPPAAAESPRTPLAPLTTASPLQGLASPMMPLPLRSISSGKMAVGTRTGSA
jgi:hypothetical protein